MMNYHGEIITPRSISDVNAEMVNSQSIQVEPLSITSEISVVSRALDPTSLSIDLNTIYGYEGPVSINIGSFGYMVSGVASGKRQGPLCPRTLAER